MLSSNQKGYNKAFPCVLSICLSHRITLYDLRHLSAHNLVLYVTLCGGLYCVFISLYIQLQNAI